MSGMQRQITAMVCSLLVTVGNTVAQEQAVADAEPSAAEASTTQALPTAQELRKARKALDAPDDHVVSQSRMFSVSGGDSLHMGAIATKADEVRGRVNALLGFEDDHR